MKAKLFFICIFLVSAQLAFSQWTQLGGDIDGENANDQSGNLNAVSLSSDGNIMAVGAPINAGNGVQSGHVRVYQWDGVSWNQLGQDINGEAFGDISGRSVSLNNDGTIVAIGAYRNDGNGSWSGHVRVYQWDGVSWNQLGQDINGEASGDNSGNQVSLSGSGNIVAIGAPGNDGNTGNPVDNRGHVRVYEYQGGNWVQLGNDIDGEAAGDGFGWSVSLNDDATIVAIGAQYNGGNGNFSGHVRVYQWDGVSWNQLGQDIDGEAAADYSGWSVSLNNNGTIVGIGAYYNDGNGVQSGHVRIYEYQGGNWVQLGSDIDGEAAGDQAGWSVSLNSDGDIVAVGANVNDVNGGSSGHVRIYEFDGLNWNQIGSDIDGEASGDQSGRSVSLNASGTQVAIGAPLNDGNGSNSGHVRVYNYPSSPYTAIPDANFEAALDALGYDDIPGDNQVLTANIEGIISLDVSSQNIADLTGIEDFTALQTLYCYSNQLTALDVSQNPALTILWAAYNQLTNLDVTQNPALTDLRCFENQLTSLDVTQNTALTNLWCHRNQLTNLQLSQSLIQIRCEFNQLTGLNVTQNTGLTFLACHENQLQDLDVSQNGGLNDLYAYANQLDCIQVANAADADAGVGIYTNWVKDGFAVYSEDCGIAARGDFSSGKDPKENAIEEAFTTPGIIVYPNPVKDKLYIALPTEEELVNASIYTIHGEQVARSKSNTLSTTHLAAGIYFVKIRLSNGENITKKVLVSGEH